MGTKMTHTLSKGNIKSKIDYRIAENIARQRTQTSVNGAFSRRFFNKNFDR
jgi:hypothetical protein